MAREKHVTHALAPDGQRILFAAEAESVSGDWYWSLRVTARALSVGVTIGPAGYGQRYIAREKLTVTDRLVYRRRPLFVARTADRDGWQIGWSGPHHDLLTGGGGTPPALGDLVAMFDLLNLRDSAEGLVLRPLAGSGTVLWAMTGQQFLTGAGSVTIYPKSQSGSLVPDRAGERVAHGEVWTKSLEIDGVSRGRVYLHAGDAGVAMVRDDREAGIGVTDEGLEALLGSLQVQWS